MCAICQDGADDSVGRCDQWVPTDARSEFIFGDNVNDVVYKQSDLDVVIHKLLLFRKI